MATLVKSLQVAGFPSVANSGNPANGTGLLGSAVIEFWSDGSIIIVTAASKRIRVVDNPQMNNLWDQILKGTNGLSTTKKFSIAS
jgi:hypothetical protein